MSLNKNIIANYAGVIVTTVLTFAVVPFYLKWLGSDAYGLVGISTLIQGWIMLLNAGLAPVTGRQAAQAQQGSADWAQTVRFFRTVDWLLAGMALFITLLAISLRYWMAQHWLVQSSLSPETIANSLVLLVAMTLIRLASSVNRGIIANLEKQVWLNTNLVIYNVLRFGVSLPLIYFFPDIEVLFVWWLAVAGLEYVSIQRKIIACVPVPVPFFAFDTAELLRHGRMAATLAFTSSIWVVITNLDKLLLSGMLTLTKYGYFSVATLLAGGVLTLVQPVAQAFQPRLTKAYAGGGINAVCAELRNCTHWMVLLVFPVGAVIFAMPQTILLLWTHDAALANNAAEILRGYVLGSTLVAAGSLLYVFQVAIGNVRWHFMGNIVFALILFPSLPWVVGRYGAEGAGWLWAGFNFVLFIFWNAILLIKIAKPLFPGWLLKDTMLPMAVSFLMALCFKWLILSRLENPLALLAGVVILTVLISATLWFVLPKRNFMMRIS